MKIISSFNLLFAATTTAKKITVNSGEAIEASFDPSTCDNVSCPVAWRPKFNHHEIQGNTKEECCDKTCVFFKCTGRYAENKAYWNNVGASPQICCDRTCGADFGCGTGYQLTDPHKAGVTHEECCEPQCILHNCTAPWASSKHKEHIVAQSDGDCCELTCAAFDCNLTGYGTNPKKVHAIGDTVQECCLPTCGNKYEIACQYGHAVRKEDANIILLGDVNEVCCTAQCKSYMCPHGYSPNSDVEDEFANTTEECCRPVCGIFNCPLEDGWANDTARALHVGNNVSKCCTPTCKHYTCNKTELWLPAPLNAKDDVIGASGPACCEASCGQHVCSHGSLSLVPAARDIIGTSDAVCCEDVQCAKYRENMTEMGDDEFCNDLHRRTCATKYHKHVRTTPVFADNGTAIDEIRVIALIPCKYDELYNLCRYDADNPVRGCYGF